MHARSFACVSLALASPEGFSYFVELVLPGGDEQLASQPGRQNGAIDEVVVKRDADVGEVVLDVAPRQALCVGGEQSRRTVLILSDGWRWHVFLRGPS